MDDIRLLCHGSPSDDGYEFLDGTSMATPMVSGAAALLFSQNPALTPADVKDTLLNSVDPVPDLAGTTVSGGRLNVHRALIGDFNPSGGGGGGGSSASTGGEGAGSIADSGSQPDAATPDSSAGEGASVVSDEVLVRYEPGSSLPERSDARADAGTVAVEGLGMARAQLLRITDGNSVAETVDQLEDQPGVAFAEPNEILRPAVVPDDSLFGLQWGLYNDGQTVNGESGTADADIDAPEAWNVLTGDPPGTPSTVVAVMDTGADLGHVDLGNEIWTNVDEIPGNATDDDSNGYTDDVNGFDFIGAEDGDPTDESGHGTHVSGIALAEGDNGTGVTGVSQHAALMTLRICQPILQSGAWSATCSTADEIQAINYAGDNGARVLNGSIEGSTFSLLAQQAMANHPEVLYVFAAGNDGSDNDTTPTYPCANDQQGGYSENNVICVAATDQDDMLANFSNYGVGSVDLGAPGVDIISTSSQASFFSDDFEAGDFDSKWANGSGSGSGTGGGSEGSDTAGSGTAVSGGANSKPNTFFKRKPGKIVETEGEKAKIVFRFRSSESGSSFRCRLDTPVFVPCPKKVVRYLEPARHVLKVKAVDSDGAADPTAAVAKFRIKRISN